MSSHNKKRLEAEERTREEERQRSVQMLWTRARAFFGPVVAALGASVIGTYYPLGAILIGLGLFILYVEIVFEPWIVKHTSFEVHCLLMAISLVPLAWFLLSVVCLSGPLEVNSFAMRHHNYPAGTEIAGIAWHKNLTELTVVLSNPVEDNYKEFDLTIHPDKWVYRGAILRDNPGCVLTPRSGKNVFFTTTTVDTVNSITMTRAAIDGPLADVHDNAGDSWHPLASDNGYRLYCDRFPSKSAVEIVFALVSPDKSQPLAGVVEWGSDRGFAKDCGKAQHDGNILDCFKDRPNPSVVRINGTYKRGLKTISFSRTVSIENAD